MRRVLPSPMDEDDRAFERILAFSWNQTLQQLRRTGWSKETLERTGKILFRVVQLARAYAKKKERHTFSEWITKAEQLGKELRDVFS